MRMTSSYHLTVICLNGRIRLASNAFEMSHDCAFFRAGHMRDRVIGLSFVIWLYMDACEYRAVSLTCVAVIHNVTDSFVLFT